MLCCVNASSYLHTNTLFPPHQISPEIRESVAKAARKLRYLNQALLSQTATLGSGKWIQSHVFNVRPFMKGCDSFIVKWQGPPRKLAKEVFVKFILAKEKMRSRKSGERFWRKTMWLEQNHTRFSTQLIYLIMNIVPIYLPLTGIPVIHWWENPSVQKKRRVLNPGTSYTCFAPRQPWQV